jgi:uncharacterized protein
MTSGAQSARRKLKSSRYNFWVPIVDGGIIYNAATGSAMRVSGNDAGLLAHALAGPPRVIDENTFASNLMSRFVAEGFLIDAGKDEITGIRERYWSARSKTPMVLTITTTQDCNLGCYYCFEVRSGESLKSSELNEIVSWTARQLAGVTDRLHVDWYGGEPLLNRSFIEEASAALQKLCAEMHVGYAASVISNGTCWPDDPADFVLRHKIRQVQISFDGMKPNHDKRRHYRRGRASLPNSSSFDEAVAVVDALLDVVRVDIRFNIDRGNQTDIEEFIGFCRDKGWFNRAHPAILQLARISSYSKRSSFMEKTQISEVEFENIRSRVRDLVPLEDVLDETTSRAVYPVPRTSVCAALSHRSVVVGADGSHFRCGLQVGEQGRAVALRGSEGLMVRGMEADWWDAFDPTTRPNCARCSFLPVCWGGCPKKHLEGDDHALQEQSLYWRRALPQKIAWQFGTTLSPNDFCFSEADQFRSQD